MKHIRADFPYFAAVWTTEAGPDEFRTICDWCNWVFDFDDRKRTDFHIAQHAGAGAHV